MYGRLRCLSIAAALFSAAVVSGCGIPAQKKQQQQQQQQQPTAKAEQDQVHSIVSLAPSNTELLLNAGAADSISGVCSNCPEVLQNGKEQLKEKPVVGSFTSVNLERLTGLKPDVILLVSGQESIFSMLKKRGFKVVLLNNEKLGNIPSNLRQIGELSGNKKSAISQANKFERALEHLSAILQTSTSRPKVFYCIWPQPLLTIGRASFLNEAITTCGGTNIAANLPQAYPHYSAEHLILADPDIIVLPYEAKNLALFKRFPWNKLRAVKENRLFYLPAPKEDMLARPTMGILEGLYWLTIKIHPELKTQLDDWHQGT